MKIIKCLSDFIAEELDGADAYISKALKIKDDYPQLAQILAALSTEEMKHMKILHDEVVKIIQDYRKEKGEPPTAMLAVYDYLHEKFIDHAKEIQIYQDMFSA